MGKTIWKFALEVSDAAQAIELPKLATPVMVDHQGHAGQVVVWFEVDPEQEPETRLFRIHGTGHMIDPAAKYIGSVNNHPTPLVWHLYEVT